MVPETLLTKARREQLSSMFCRRGRFCSAKDTYFLVVLFCAIFILVTCKKYPLNEAQSRIGVEACKLYTENFDTDSRDVFDGNVNPELVSRHSVKRHGLERICPSLNSFCFPSTLTGFLLNEVSAESEATDASAWSEGFSYGLTQARNNLSWSPDHGIFRLLGGRVISCSSDSYEFASIDPNNKNGQQTDGSYTSTLIDHELHRLKSGDNAETVKSGFGDGFSRPPVEIKPLVLDWGPKNMYYPSPSFLTVKNVDTDSFLSIYDPYSSNSQFYPCSFSDILLAPGEIASICFVFFPTKLGLSSSTLVIQTSFGGFLIQAKGFAVESPYLVKPLSGLDVSSDGRRLKNFSLFNPFNETLHVEEVTAWISISTGQTSRSSKAICRIHNLEDSSQYSMLRTKEWLYLESAQGCLPQISIRPHKNWEVGPNETEIVMELDISDHFEGKIVGAFCLQLVRSSDNKIETVVVPLEAELSSNSASDAGHVSVSLEALVPCGTSGSAIVAVSVRNEAPFVLSVTDVRKVGENTENLQVKSTGGLLLFPRSVTQVAILSYADLENLDLNMNCKLFIQTNDTRSSEIEIPCIELIGVCSRSKLDSAVGYAQGINNVDDLNVRERSSSSGMQPRSKIKAVDTREADELLLKNWKSQATKSSLSVLDDNELLFPMVHIGNHSSQWIAVKNPSEEPIMVQLILNSAEIVYNCRTPHMHLQPSSSNILVLNKSFAPTRYGFSLSKDAMTEALVHPHGSASLGPIIFQPSNRCEWGSSALIRNNLSGVEWLSLRGFGGSLSLVLLEGSNPVHSLDFKSNLPSLLNLSFPENLHSINGKSPSCCHSLIKEVNAKNMGDFPLEVRRIEVSGSECGLDGFLVRNCKGFSLPPGGSVMLQISYQSDFSAATIQRDLELALTSGILVIPMKASSPIYLLDFCKRSIFLMRLKKVVVVILSAAALLFLLVCLLFPHVIHFSFNDFKSGKKNSLMDIPLETRVISSVLSNSAPIEKSDTQNGSDSQDLRVRIGKDKGRRRRKKKSHLEVSSSQSGNSTPSPPLSPAASITPKRAWHVSPGKKQNPPEARSPFSRAAAHLPDRQESSEPSSKVSLLSNEGSYTPVKPSKVGSRAVLLPCATFPGAGRDASSRWTNRCPLLASTSPIAPHARAPGSKIDMMKKNGEVGEKVGVGEKFTYNIWGDHIQFGLRSSWQSKLDSDVLTPAMHNNSQSFFVREPQTLIKSTLLNPAISALDANK